ncbi:MAG: class I SAM-dependent methyltransferase [Nanoarchaeota archaeon]|nr:class I SAM-dependent methyltransferase [Nanoarchaeota archaeon]
MTYYDEIADGYDDLHKEEQEKKLVLIKKLISPSKNDLLLDVGCGSGISTRFWDCDRVGIDPSQKLIEIAIDKDGKGRYLVGSAESMPFKNCEFDFVISVSAIHNFKDYVKGLQEMHRVGKGTFVFSVLKKSAKFSQIMQAIMMNFPVQRIIKQEKDVVFLATATLSKTKFPELSK